MINSCLICGLEIPEGDQVCDRCKCRPYYKDPTASKAIAKLSRDETMERKKANKMIVAIRLFIEANGYELKQPILIRQRYKSKGEL